MSCFKCKTEFPSVDDCLSCSACQKLFHVVCFGEELSNVKKLPKSKVKLLKCQTCSNQAPMSSSDDLEKFEDIRAIIKSELATALKPIVTAIDLASQKSNKFMEKLDKIDEEVSALKLELHSVSSLYSKAKESISTLNQEVTSLRSSLNELEQYSRNCNVEISGIPESTSEDLSSVIQRVANVIGFDGPLDLAKIHRVPSRVNKRVKSIICQFNKRSDRDRFHDLARMKRDLDIKHLDDSYTSGKFFVNDHLTHFSKSLLFKAKEYRKEHADFEFVWCRGGKVFMRKNAKSRVVRIKSVTDISLLNI